MKTEKPTICQVLHSLTIGGAEVLAARLVRDLQDRYRFVFACLDDLGALGEALRGEGFHVEVIGRRPGFDLQAMRALGRFWRAERVELVHAHQYTPFFYCLAARGLRRGPPLLFTEHGRFFPDYPRRKRIWFNRAMLRRCDRVVAVGEAVRRALVNNEGIPAPRIQVIYNGVDPAAFQARPADPPALRRAIGVGPEDFLVLQVARLDHLKDHGTAVRTMKRVVEKRPDARLVLAGEGPEREKIEEEIDRLDLQGNVLLLGSRSDVASLLPIADVFLLTSISEGIPVTVLEAMAAGLPVVSTEVGGLGEIVEPEKTGLLAPSGSAAALAEAILRLAGDATLRRRMGACGAERAERCFSQVQMHGGYVRCYEEMLRG